MLVDFFASPWHQKCVLGDISQDLGGRMPLKTSAVLSLFTRKQTSPRKRPPPTERLYQQQRKEGESVLDKGPFLVYLEPEILISKHLKQQTIFLNQVLTKPPS